MGTVRPHHRLLLKVGAISNSLELTSSHEVLDSVRFFVQS